MKAPQRQNIDLSEGLLRLFFKPKLLLLLARRLAWFFTASSHMPMLPLLPSMPPGPPQMPTPSPHWPPIEELPIDMPECCKSETKRALTFHTQLCSFCPPPQFYFCFYSSCYYLDNLVKWFNATSQPHSNWVFIALSLLPK